MNQSKQYYILFLIIGFLDQILPGLLPISWGAGLLTLIWIYAFWELVCRFQEKKERILTGAVFVIGYGLRFAGASGSFWMDFGLFGIFGLALYAVFCISAHFMRRWDTFAGTLLFPAIWILAYLLATVLRFPVMARVDMMFADMTVLMHTERLIGSVGFSFVIIWVVSLLRFAVFHQKLWYLVFCFGLYLAMLLPGTIALYQNTAAAESVRAAYTTGPSTTYFAIRERDDRLVGVIDLRHHIDHPILGVWGGHCGYSVRPSERRKGYATEMLRLNLRNAREMGIPKLLVTCNEHNIASEKAILVCGGILESIVEVDGNRIKRYWIATV